MIRAYGNFLSGINAFQRSLEQTADNLANVNTVAYKRSEVSFSDLLYCRLQEKRLPVAPLPPASDPQAGLGVRPAAVVPFLEQGPLAESTRPLDLAIEGDGFFRIIQSDGAEAFTRQGNFSVDSDGRLITAAGDYLDTPFTLLGMRLETVAIGPDGAVLAVNEAGEIESLGVVPLYRFVNTAGLFKDGGGRHLATEASGAPVAGVPQENGFGTLRQYYLEGSNVNLGLDMIQLMTAQRALQANARGLVTADELQALTLQVRA
ncbi:MAG: flagellar hook-basal body protein [Bacillota bacterium]